MDGELSLHLGSIYTVSHHHIIHIITKPQLPSPSPSPNPNPNPNLIFTTPPNSKKVVKPSQSPTRISHPILHASTV
ncbi:hypothetical protein HZ326_4904 [Fusarium oxysporum f. sp. albedinis]|nr:hypothetical protein HZ326_4904 [Fusarium oxysporum f. sp. albedinis]